MRQKENKLTPQTGKCPPPPPIPRQNALTCMSAGLKTQYGTQTTRYYLPKLPNNYEEPFQKGVIWALQRITQAGAPRGTPSNLHYAFSRLQVHCIHSANTQFAGFSSWVLCTENTCYNRLADEKGMLAITWPTGFQTGLWPRIPLFKEKLIYGEKRKYS